MTRTGWCSGLGRGSPASSRTCSCPSSPRRCRRRRARKLVALNLSPQPGETDGFSPETPPRSAGRACPRPGVDVVLADRQALPTRAELRECRGRASGPSSCSSPTWRATTASAPGTTPSGCRRRSVRRNLRPDQLDRWEGRPHGDDGRGQGRADPADRHQALLPQGGGGRRCCGSRAGCTSWRARRWSRRRSTPGPPRGGCARTSPRCTATRSDVHVVVRRRASARAAAMSCGSRRTATALARQTGLLDGRGRPVRGLPPQVVSGAHVRRRGGLARRLPRPRLADRAGPVVVAGDHLPGPGVGAGAGRRGAPARCRREGARGARRRPSRRSRRRRDRRRC